MQAPNNKQWNLKKEVVLRVIEQGYLVPEIAHIFCPVMKVT